MNNLPLGVQAAQLVGRHITNFNQMFKFSFKKALGFTKPDFQKGLSNERQIVEQAQQLAQQFPKDKSQFETLLLDYVNALIKAGQNLEKLCLDLWRSNQQLQSPMSKKELKIKLEEQQLLELAYLQIGEKLNQHKSDR